MLASQSSSAFKWAFITLSCVQVALLLLSQPPRVGQGISTWNEQHATNRLRFEEAPLHVEASGLPSARDDVAERPTEAKIGQDHNDDAEEEDAVQLKDAHQESYPTHELHEPTLNDEANDETIDPRISASEDNRPPIVDENDKNSQLTEVHTKESPKHKTAVFESLRIISARRPANADNGKLGRMSDALTNPPLDKINRLFTGVDSLPKPTSLSQLKIYIYDMPDYFNFGQQMSGRSGQSPRFQPLFKRFVEMEQSFFLSMKASPYVTTDPLEANYFYIPVFPLTYCGRKKYNSPAVRQDYEYCRAFLSLSIQYIRRRYPMIWNRKDGADHIIFTGFDYDSCLTHIPAQVKQFGGRLVSIEKAVVVGLLGPQHPSTCTRSQDALLPPYLTRNFRTIVHSSPNRSRPFLMRRHKFYFRGQFDSSPLRWQFIAPLAKVEGNFISRRPVSVEQYASEMMDAKFCLVPKGAAPWTFRFAEAIYAGCLPVIILENQAEINTYPLPCSKFIEYSKFVTFTTKTSTNLNDVVSIISGNLFPALEAMEQAKKYMNYDTDTLHCFYDQLLHETRWGNVPSFQAVMQRARSLKP